MRRRSTLYCFRSAFQRRHRSTNLLLPPVRPPGCWRSTGHCYHGTASTPSLPATASATLSWACCRHHRPTLTVCLRYRESITRFLIITHDDGCRVGRFSPSFVCLFIRTISQKPLNLTYRCSTMSPGYSLILGSKGLRSQNCVGVKYPQHNTHCCLNAVSF